MIVDKYDLCSEIIYLGRCGEYGVRRVDICIRPWIDSLGAGAVGLMVRRSEDETPYEIAVAETDGVVSFVPSEVDTAFPGIGLAELSFTPASGGLAKSKIFRTQIDPSMDAPTAEPEGFESWYAKLLKVKADTDAIKDQAETAADRAEAALASIPITWSYDGSGTVTMTIGGSE